MQGSKNAKLTTVGPEPGDVGSSSSSVDSNAGASGSDGGSFSLSRGGVIAIIVVATFVCVFGGKFPQVNVLISFSDLTSHSYLGNLILLGQKEGLENP